MLPKGWLFAECFVRQTIQEVTGGCRLCVLPVLALALTLTPGTVCAAGTQRQLDFYHTHTEKSLSIIYYDGKEYIPSALEQINHFLSDFRSGDTHPIDTAVLDILFELRSLLDSVGVFEVISGYRSPETNAMLRKQGRSVAKRSLHMEGKAIDVRLRGVNTSRLYEAAIGLKAGGIGFYSASDFVHIDSGRVRTW